MKKRFFVSLFFIHLLSFGQHINPRNEFKDGFGLKVGGPTFFVRNEVRLSNQFPLEVIQIGKDF